MSHSITVSETTTFTVTHARHIAAKVATDLKRIQRFYGKPSDSSIQDYETEIIVLIKEDAVRTVTYGFMRNDKWIEPTLIYTAKDLASATGADDDPGRVRAGQNIAGAVFHSYLIFSDKWTRLSQGERDAIRKSLPFQRGGAPEPSVDGYLDQDRTYSSGGRALSRSSVRSLG
jgi:hypothetical protein